MADDTVGSLQKSWPGLYRTSAKRPLWTEITDEGLFGVGVGVRGITQNKE